MQEVTSVLEKPSRVKYRQSIGYDDNGEIVYDSFKLAKRSNGDGFVLSYTEKMSDFLVKCRVGSTVRVFLYLAHHQQYGNDGVTFGYRCSHKYLQQVLGVDRKTLYTSLTYLKEKLLVNEIRVDGVCEFMVNPAYVTIGVDKKRRVVEWEARCRQYLTQQHSR